jgi:hypothetical protein
LWVSKNAPLAGWSIAAEGPTSAGAFIREKEFNFIFEIELLEHSLANLWFL